MNCEQVDDAPLLYKVLVVGDYAVGKTSLIRRYCLGDFTSNYRITIGVDFCVKSLDNCSADQPKISLQLWDIAGHERFGAMTRVYYKFAIAAVVVFDLTRLSTLESARRWRQDITEKVVLPDGSPIPMVLMANKSDVADVDIPAATLDQFVQEQEFLCWMPTSAKTGDGIEAAFGRLVQSIVSVTREMQQSTDSAAAVNLGASPQDQRKKCC